MYSCIKRCGANIGTVTYYVNPLQKCPRCGGKIMQDKQKKTCQAVVNLGKLYFHKRWTAQNMQVGLDKIYCPTRQSYLDACKHGRVIHAGTREITIREIDPVGAKD